MAIRTILTKEQDSLYKRSREVTEFNPRLHQLLLVLETNVAEEEAEYIIELVNPEIVEQSGEQSGPEGCLSFPGEYGIVKRPMNVTVKAQDRNGNWFTVSGTGLTARCFLWGHPILRRCL